MRENGFASYAGDNTPYVLRHSIDDVIKSFEDDSINLFQCVLANQMKANSNKCHLSPVNKVV